MKKLLVFATLTFSLLVLSLNANAQLTDIVNFNNNSSPKGASPYGDVIRVGKLLYGMTWGGGAHNGGVVFSIDTNGLNYTDLWDFTGASGDAPNGSLIFSEGKLYGMTANGGTHSSGIVFSIDTNGTNYKDLWNFSSLPPSTNGAYPEGNLTLSGHTLFGMTYQGGVSSEGNIFSIDTNGTNYKDLFEFDGTNGAYPNGSLTFSSGKLYGMATMGGLNNIGDIFSIDTTGANFKDMLDFNGFNGSQPYYSNLTLSGTKLFGMTGAGGISGTGNIFSIDTTGANYKNLWIFDSGGDTNGSSPLGSLILYGRTLYGMTSAGGLNSDGNIFSIDTTGSSYKDLQDFNNTNGNQPYGSLIAFGPYLCGMTNYGGTHSDGVVFKWHITLKTTISDTNVYCHGNNTGSATAIVTGGFGPYSYLWNDTRSQTTVTATGLSAGTYTVYVHDVYDNKDSAVITLTQPNVLTASANTTANVICHGTNTGSTSSTVGGGTTPYTYLWSGGGGTNATASGLTAGTYNLSVTDNNGCSATATTIITQPNALTVFANTVNDVSCRNGSNGSAVSTVNGGTSPFRYLWTGGGTNSTISGLTAGTYSLTVSDACGDMATATTIITQPNALSATATTANNVSCHGVHDGGISSAVSGGTAPFTYSWSPSGETTASAFGLTAGSYTLTVTDICGDATTASATITQPVALVVSALITSNVTCNGLSNGSASSSISGGTTPYTYSWSNGGSNTFIGGLTAGTYTLTVTDNNGCADMSEITITQPLALSSTSTVINVNSTLACNGRASVTPSGGTAPYTYKWSPGGGTNDSINGKCAGDYCCKVTDANGCKDSTCVTIANVTGIAGINSSSNNINVYPDPNNGSFTMAGVVQGQVIELYNYMGQKLSSTIADNSTMHFNISNQPNGIYMYRVLSEDGTLVGQGKLIIQK